MNGGKALGYKEIDALANCGCQVLRQELLCDHTTFKIGGPADRLVTVYTREQLRRALKATAKLPLFLLGNGSNVLVSDQGFRGVVLCLDGDFKKISQAGNRISAGAAVRLSALCVFARDAALSGLEFAYGIPGSVGGALYMNAGAYGGEIKDAVLQCEAMDFDGHMSMYSREEMALSYRNSCFQRQKRLITDVTFLLEPGEKTEITQKMEELMCRRKSKQPYNMPSGGSTFKRPQGAYAAALIEACGLKGYAVGDAQVSEKHAGFVINKGHATCRDVLQLIEHIKKKVRDEKNITLECEIRMLGPE